MPLDEVLNNLNQENKKQLLFFLENPQYNKMPYLSYGEFIDKVLGVKDDVYQKVREEGEKIIKGIVEGRYNEGVALWGIGSGKSFLASTISLWFVHYLLCLKNPHKYFGITNDKPIAVVNMGTTGTQAKNVIFAGLKTMIKNSPWFMQFNPEVLQTEIRFEKGVSLYSGNSQETMPIGMNVICGVLDEAAWYVDTENHSIAENIYNTMKNRIVSRFGNKGFIFVISAPRYVDDFITSHYEKVKDNPNIYSSKYKTWEVKDRDRMSPETFVFDTGTEKWVVPNDFKTVAELNPEKFMRDFGAMPSLVLQPYDRDAERIKDCMTLDYPEENGRLKSSFRGLPGVNYYIHIDLGYKHDACGFAMGHLNGYDESEGELKPKVAIDYIVKISAPPEGEVRFSDVRSLIYDLQARGFYIKKVTYDGFQSVDSIQILRSKGIESEVLSVDRTMAPYDTMKEMIHSNRFVSCYYQPLYDEYIRLELVKGKKVDHPAKGSKDVADAVAGVCYMVASDTDNVASHWKDEPTGSDETEFGNILDKPF